MLAADVKAVTDGGEFTAVLRTITGVRRVRAVLRAPRRVGSGRMHADIRSINGFPAAVVRL